jgi:hypothetical protein
MRGPTGAMAAAIVNSMRGTLGQRTWLTNLLPVEVRLRTS